jgi:uncharacterized protein (TIGR02246 family)
MTRDQNKATLQQANAAIAAGDHEGFLELCTDDTNWTFVGDTTLEGKAAVRRWLTETYVTPPKNDVTDMIADGDSLAVYGEITTTDAAGTVARAWYCDVWRFRDGKLAELRAFVVDAT